MNKYQEALDRRRFFNQRAGRMLWNGKPKEIQDQDIEYAEKDFDILQNALNELQVYRETISKIDIKKLNEAKNG